MSAISGWIGKTATTAYKHIKEQPKAMGIILLGGILTGVSYLCSNSSTTAALASSTFMLAAYSNFARKPLPSRKQILQASVIEIKLFHSINPALTVMDKVNITNVLAKISEEEKESIAICALQLISTGMSSFQIEYIIEALATVPVDERNNVTTFTLKLIAEDMDGVQIAYIIEALAKVPADERNNVVTFALKLIPAGVDNFEIARIIEALATVPADERNNVVTFALKLISLGLSSLQIAYIIKVAAKLPVDEMNNVTTFALKLIPADVSGNKIARIIESLAKIPVDEREPIFVLAFDFLPPGFEGPVPIELIEIISQIQADNREAIVSRAAVKLKENLQEFLLLDEANQRGWVSELFATPLDQELPSLQGALAAAHAAGVDVHNGERDETTIGVMDLLRTATGAMSAAEIAQGVAEFINYLENAPVSDETRALAFRSLNGPIEEEATWNCLLGAQHCMAYQISGDEVIARHWKYANTFRDPLDETRNEVERNMIREGMVYALADSFDDEGKRLCDGGKVRRMVSRTLQGRLSGMIFDEPADVPAPQGLDPAAVAPAQNAPVFLPLERALAMFLQIPAHNGFETQAKLITTALFYLHTAPAIEKIAFLEAIEDYANVEDMKKVESASELLDAAAWFYNGADNTELKRLFEEEIIAYANQQNYFAPLARAE